MVAEHCPDILRTILSIRANSFDCRTLYRTLCTTESATCDQFGNYLYLITCKRVCYLCFVENLDYLPTFLTQAARLTGLSREKEVLRFQTSELCQEHTPPLVSSLGATLRSLTGNVCSKVWAVPSGLPTGEFSTTQLEEIFDDSWQLSRPPYSVLQTSLSIGECFVSPEESGRLLR